MTVTFEQLTARARTILHDHGEAKHITPEAFDELKAATAGVMVGLHLYNSDPTAYMNLALAFMIAAWEMGYMACELETVYGEALTCAHS